MDKKKDFQTEERGLLQYDPIVVLRDVLKRWLVILMLAVVVAVGAYTASTLTYKPVYRSTTTLVVSARGTSTTVYSNQSSTATLASVFTEMLNSSVFRKVVLEEAGLTAFDGTIAASQVTDTNLLSVKVEAADPRTAFVVSRAILNNYEEVTRQVIGDVILQVLQEPAVATAPSNPLNALDVTGKATLVAVVVACLLCAWRSMARDTVRSAKEARKKLDCNYLGEIPHERKYRTSKALLRRSGSSILISNPAISFRFTEAVRKLRRRTEQQLGKGKVLMVTSLLENEGKSTVAVNLAMALARKHPRVLLIDCDLRKPACAKQLNMDWIGAGVKDVLSGDADPEDLIQEDSRSGLFVLLQRDGTSRSGDLVGSHNMKMLLSWARKCYDYVILDMPPMAMVTDAESVMNVADGSLLVVRQNTAPAKSLNKVIADLSQGRAKLIGCVLNNVYTTSLSSGQGQGNAYGRYGRYGRYNNYGRYGRYGGTGSYAANDFDKQD